MLAFAISQFLFVPGNPIAFSFGVFIIPIPLDLATLITFAIAAMTASGTDWVLRDHPTLTGKSTLPNLLLPALTAWVLSLTLNNMTANPAKWLVLISGGIFLLIVIVSEYLVLFTDTFHAPVAAGILTAIAYAMLLAMTVTLESTDQRLILSLPVLTVGSSVLSLRILQLQGIRTATWLYALGGMLLTIQVSTSLHYLPLGALPHGIIVFGSLYTAINFVLNIEQDISLRRSALEAGIPLVLIVLLALYLN